MIQPKLVDEGIWRGPEPREFDDWKLLKSLGVKYALDLETGAAILPGDGYPLQEARLADQYGIRIYNHPLGVILPPTEDEMRMAINLMMDKKPIYVHCKEGVDRTGMMCAYYRIKVLGWSPRAAVEEMKALGSHPWYFYWWATLS